MTQVPENARIADQPLAVRREAEEAKRKEIEEGLTRKHLAVAADEQWRTALAFALLPVLAAKLRGD